MSKHESVDPVSVRELLRWFDAQRRGLHIVRQIRKALAKAKLKTDPDFEGAYLDGLIEFNFSKNSAGRKVPSATFWVFAESRGEFRV